MKMCIRDRNRLVLTDLTKDHIDPAVDRGYNQGTGDIFQVNLRTAVVVHFILHVLDRGRAAPVTFLVNFEREVLRHFEVVDGTLVDG